MPAARPLAQEAVPPQSMDNALAVARLDIRSAPLDLPVRTQTPTTASACKLKGGK